MNEEKTKVTILKIIWTDNTKPKEKLRTKEWLLKISEIMDFDKDSPTKDNEVSEEEKDSDL
jgi:hypothetical protein